MDAERTSSRARGTGAGVAALERAGVAGGGPGRPPRHQGLESAVHVQSEARRGRAGRLFDGHDRGIRDPYILGRLDWWLAGMTQYLEHSVKAILGLAPGEYQIALHTYGRDGVMGELEPECRSRSEPCSRSSPPISASRPSSPHS